MQVKKTDPIKGTNKSIIISSWCEQSDIKLQNSE